MRVRVHSLGAVALVRLELLVPEGLLPKGLLGIPSEGIRREHLVHHELQAPENKTFKSNDTPSS